MKRRYQAAIMCGLLVLGTLGVYWPIRHFDFVNFDDQAYVTENPMVQQGLVPGAIAWAFSTTSAEFWHPLTWLSHMLDVQLHGTRAGGHHLTSLLFHMANTLLLWLVFARMTSAVWRSGLVAALFALHPLHVESVAWIAERKDVLSTFFGFLSLWAYVGYAESNKSKAATRKRRFYVSSLLLFALSLMSKPMLLTLPCLLLLLDYWPLGRFARGSAEPFLQTRLPHAISALRRLVIEKLPWFALSLAAGVGAFWAQASGRNLSSLAQFPLPLRCANAVMSSVRYLRKALWPSDLAYYYPYPDSWPIGEVAGAGAVLVVATVAALRWSRWRPYLATGWLWYVVALAPVIGLVQVGEHALADRYSYVPLIGVFVLVVWGAADLARRVRYGRALLAAAAATAVVLCAVGARRQVGYWSDSETLSRHALAVTDNNYVAQGSLGAALGVRDRLDEALPHLEEALRIERRLRAKPDLAIIRYNLGTVLARKGRLEEARVHLLRALEVESDAPRVHHNLAGVLALQGKLDDAIAYYQEALRLQPGYHEARVNLTAVRAQRERWIEASARYQSGAQLKEQQPREAAEAFREAIRLRPDWAEVMNNLAWLLATHTNAAARNGPEAVSLAERACVLTGGTNWVFVSTLAAAYAEAGRFSNAVSTQQKVCDLGVTQGPTAQAESFQNRLELYRSGHAYRRP